MGTAGFAQISAASTLTTLSNFPARGPEVSQANLTRFGRDVFGALVAGGKTGNGGIFKVHLNNGSEKNVHVFTGAPDGAGPLTSLTAANGSLYGTTFSGGTNGAGTIYTLRPLTGQYATVYSFPTNSGDPSSALIPYGSTLIGTTDFGGPSERGSLYQFDPGSGTVTTLYSFKMFKKIPDGEFPRAPLVVGHKLYGVAGAGGDFDTGTLYEFDFATGHEKTLFSFGGPLGSEPSSNLVKIGSSLYGVIPSSGSPPYGTFYRFDLSTKTASAVHMFNGQAGGDGANPNSGLILANGLIYGTTSQGGTSNFGTVYTIDPATGTEATLYSFANGTDGGNPEGGLTQSHGSFYGTTTTGGANGTGTVFSFSP